jgi:hypothetical protein
MISRATYAERRHKAMQDWGVLCPIQTRVNIKRVFVPLAEKSFGGAN